MVKSWLGILVGFALLLVGCADANQSNSPDEVARGVTCQYPSAGQPAKPVDPPSTTDVVNQGTVSATIQLNDDEVVLTLDRASAPCTVHSFVSLVEQGYYNDTLCHRLVDYGIFVLQCGDPTGTGTGGPGYTIPDEINEELDFEDYAQGAVVYPAGTVAMAKLQAPNTGGSQFFLVWADSPLPPEYTVFGTFDEDSLSVIGQIAAQGVDASDDTSPIAPADISVITLG